MFILRNLSRLFIIMLSLSALSLASAYTAEYGFGLMPCELCLKQRVPYAVVIALSLLGLWLQKKRPHSLLNWLVVVGISLSFIAGTALATYHAGVEKKIFPGPSGCTQAESGGAQTIEDLRNQILGAPIVACDKPAWEWNGITMAGMNAVWSFILLLFVAYYGRKLSGDKHPWKSMLT